MSRFLGLTDERSQKIDQGLGRLTQRPRQLHSEHLGRTKLDLRPTLTRVVDLACSSAGHLHCAQRIPENHYQIIHHHPTVPFFKNRLDVRRAAVLCKPPGWQVQLGKARSLWPRRSHLIRPASWESWNPSPDFPVVSTESPFICFRFDHRKHRRVFLVFWGSKVGSTQEACCFAWRLGGFERWMKP